ncbi:MAG: nuclear transport factor 2 family protein [Verrucomicrobiota bacterium]|nr:nuclear transport factor 2 family protein [Verrucomicrobiota bacterium]
MKIKCLIPLLVAAFFPVSIFAQASPTPAANVPVASSTIGDQAAPDAGELTTLLKQFLDGAGRNDVAMHDRFWADDLIYTGSVGRRIGKAEIMREVRAEPHPKPGDEDAVYSAEDIRVHQYGTTAVVAFRLVVNTKKGDKPGVTNLLNSGTFLKRDGKWQVVNWQATKMPADGEPKK